MNPRVISFLLAVGFILSAAVETQGAKFDPNNVKNCPEAYDYGLRGCLASKTASEAVCKSAALCRLRDCQIHHRWWQGPNPCRDSDGGKKK